MIHLGSLLFGALFLVSTASAQVCEKDSPAQKAQSVLESMVRPANMLGSCALDQERGVSTWKDQLPQQTARFVEKNIFSSKSGINPDIKKALDRDLFGKNVEMLGLAGKKNRLEWNIALEDKIKSSKLVEKMTALAKEKRCAKGVDFDFQPYSGMYTELVRDDEAKSKAALETTIRNDEADDSAVVFCSPLVKLKSELVEAPGSSVAYDVPKDLFFKDNQSAISEEKMKLLKADLVKKLSASDANCKQKRIDAVDILTSSNLLANSESVGRWDFAKLSDSRANFIKDQLSALFGEQEKNSSFPKFAGQSSFEKITTINSIGENGDGTSGPCPYKKRDDKGVLVVERDLAVKAADLEKNKYAKINFSISCLDKTAAGKVVESQSVPYFATQCFSIQTQCKAN